MDRFDRVELERISSFRGAPASQSSLKRMSQGLVRRKMRFG